MPQSFASAPADGESARTAEVDLTDREDKRGMDVLYAQRRRLWLSIGAATLILWAAIGPLASRPALAGFTTCTSDPIVSLSNGAQIDLKAAIGDTSSDVRSVTYTVHGPAGTRMLSILNTDSLLGLVEKVQYYADDPANSYDTYTTVVSGQNGVSVTAQTTLVSVLGLAVGLKSASGYNAQPLHVRVTGLL
jgi:hypothetical protein